MRTRSLRNVLAIGILTVASFIAPNAAASNATDYIVGFTTLPTDLRHYHGDRIVKVDADPGYLLVRTHDASRLERDLRLDPRVSYFERDDALYHVDVAPSDPSYAQGQYDLQPSTTNVELAWTKTTGEPAVKVCVVDTGQYRNHQDLKRAHWAEWKDFVHNRSKAYDDNGHGTHVTGTIGALLDNSKGIAGIAQVSLAGAKVLDAAGSGTISAVASGIRWCADVGSAIISLSLGGLASTTLGNAVTYATQKGAFIVAAAGNDGPCSRCVNYPAAYKQAFAVACTDAHNRRCSFSSQGPEVDIAAPGMNIRSTYPTGLEPCGKRNSNCYATLSGTSMSTPHVAGLAALVKSAHPAFTAAQIRERITSTALDLGAKGTDPQFGAGLMRGEAV